MKLYTNTSFASELIDEAKLFFREPFQIAAQPSADIYHFCEQDGSEVSHTVVYRDYCVVKKHPAVYRNELQRKKIVKQNAKCAIYECLKQATGTFVPWGALTGIRPTKLARELEEEFSSFETIFRTVYDVSEEKIRLAERILLQQERMHKGNDCDTDVYVGIPFCVSKCSYCSFSGGEIGKMQKLVQPYLDALFYDLNTTKRILQSGKYHCKNLYIGGGTPTSLDVVPLEEVIRTVSEIPHEEFTVEAGRPDTITKEKLDVFARYGVNRVSVNPQTFCQSTLDRIGRRHTVRQIYEAFEAVRPYGFVVNADFIAGLPGESFEEFCFGIDEICKIRPQNVTVHSLALKRGAELKQNGELQQNDTVQQMIEYAHRTLSSAGYEPYYLYRQKYMSANLENVGFTLPGYVCRYNVDNMEETTSVLACGSGAISKRIFGKENRIERAANAKDVAWYVGNVQEICRKKERLFLDETSCGR